MIQGMGQVPRMAFDKLRLSGVLAQFYTTPARPELVEGPAQTWDLKP